MPEKMLRDRLRLRFLVGALLTIALLAALSIAIREAMLRREQVSDAISERGQAAIREYDAFFLPIRDQMAVLHDWGREGKLDPSHPASLDRLLLPALEHQNWASEMVLVSGNGTIHRIQEGPDGWQSSTQRETTVPLHESWYLAALLGKPGEIHWTAGNDTPGLWAAIAWKRADSEEPRGIAGIRISTSRIERTVARSPVGSSGLIAIVGPQQRLFWHMREFGPRFRPANPNDLLDPDAGPERLLAETFFERIHGGAHPEEPFHFRDQGQTWWGWRGKVLALDGERDLLLLSPESDLTRGRTIVGDPASYLLLALFLACLALLARRIFRDRRRLDLLTRANLDTRIPEPELRALIAGGEGDRLEFKASIRWCRRHQEIRHQIELSWLKTVVAFLNTRGGTILLGVADDGTITGLDADRFANDDRCLLYLNDLLQRHVGVEFRPFLRGAIRRIDGIAILVLQVLPADRPAFLIEQSDEQFYIRMGPATRRLNLRQTFAYLEEFAKR